MADCMAIFWDGAPVAVDLPAPELLLLLLPDNAGMTKDCWVLGEGND